MQQGAVDSGCTCRNKAPIPCARGRRDFPPLLESRPSSVHRRCASGMRSVPTKRTVSISCRRCVQRTRYGAFGKHATPRAWITVHFLLKTCVQACHCIPLFCSLLNARSGHLMEDNFAGSVLMAQGKTRFSRRTHRMRNAQCFKSTMVRELTFENHPYAVELQGAKEHEAVYREGDRWFADDGTPVAESAEIIAIRIPARRM